MKTVETYPWIIKATIEPKELDTFRDITSDLIPQLSTTSESAFLDEMQVRGIEARERLPEITDLIDSIKEHKGHKIVIVDFSAKTTEDIPSTPTAHLKHDATNLFSPDIYRGLLIGIADWYGYGYTTQQNGIIHNNIIQVKELENVAGHSASAPHELGLHVEDASYNLGEDHDISPDFLTLHYFRNPHLVPTLISIPNWNQIAPTTRDKLSEEWFFNRTNPAQGGDKNNPTNPVSITYGPEQDPWLRLNTAKLDFESYEQDQQAALRELRDHLEEQRIDLHVENGQVAIIDNRRVLHGRPAFKKTNQPRYDGTDRWQRRLVVSNDASRIQQYEASYRKVDPAKVLFSE